MYKDNESNFISDIKKMTRMYEQPVNEKPVLLGVKQLENFKSILAEEVNEVDEIIANYKKVENNLSDEAKVQILTEVSDWLGDMVVYITNEAVKHGIELDETLKIIMQSNFSKMGADGKPIKDERGKFLKGPNYWKPEPKISELLKEKLK